MVKFKNRVINWQIRCNTQWQKALPWGTMITGIFIFHYNTIIPLKKVSDSFELDTFLETVLIQLFHSPDFLAEGAKLGQYLIALDSHGKLAWEENTTDSEGKKAHVVEILTESTANGYKDFLRRKGISYLLCGKDRVDLSLACEKIKDLLHVDTMILGGGGTVNWSFLEAGLVDEVSQVIAPAADGSTETQTLFMAKKGLSSDEPVLFTPLSVEIMADDAVWIRWKVDGKSDIDFDGDPEFRAVQEMIRSHRGK